MRRATMPRPTTIIDCMHKNPLTISVEANIAEAVEVMVDSLQRRKVIN
jgi:hypothetical protein